MKIKRIIASVLSLCFVIAATIVGCPEGDFFSSAKGEVSINETIVIEDGKLVSGSSALIDNGYIVVGDEESDCDESYPTVYTTNAVSGVSPKASLYYTYDGVDSTTGQFSNNNITSGSHNLTVYNLISLYQTIYIKNEGTVLNIKRSSEVASGFIRNSFTGNMIEVTNGAVLNLEGQSSGANNRFVINGGTVGINSAFGTIPSTPNSGGAIIYAKDATVNLKHVNFVRNNNTSSLGNGGAIYLENSDLTITGNINFNTVTCTNSGGAIYATGDCTITINANGYVNAYTSKTPGASGGVFSINNGAKLTIKHDGTANTNLNIGDDTGEASYSKNGGLIYTSGEGAEVYFDSGLLKHSYADYGGGVYVDDGATFKMDDGAVLGGVILTGTNATYKDNNGLYAAFDGGAVYVAEGGRFEMNGGIIRHGIASATVTETNNAISFEMNTNKSNGGGVCVNGGTFVMTGGTIGENGLSNVATYGGGVAVINGGSFTVSGNSVIAYNGKQGTTIDGGGIYSHGTGTKITIDNVTVSNNVASHGAGIYSNTNVDITMNNGSISNNQFGGGVFVYNGSQFIMNNGSINNNVLAANNTNMADLGGAGVCILPNFAQTRDTKFTIKNGTISGNINNLFNGGGVSVARRNDHIGGIFVMEGGQVNGNSTTKHGGAISILSGYAYISGNSTVDGNTAANDGGAIYCDNSRVEIGIKGGENTVQIRNNKAGVGAALYSVYCSGSNDAIDEITAKGIFLYNGTVTDNTDNGYGAVLLRACGLFVMYDGFIGDNKTGTQAAGSNRAVYVSGGEEAYMSNTAIINGGTLEGNEYSNTTLQTTNGGVILINVGRVEINGGTITKGYAPLGGGVYVGGNAYTEALKMTGGAITGNNAYKSDGITGAGGGVYLNPGKTFTMSGGTISNNQSIEGGGVYVGSATMLMSGEATIENNTATKYYGGGVALVGGTFTSDGGYFTGNYAKTYGGAIFVSHGLITVNSSGVNGIANIVGTTFKNNTTWISGGAIFAHSYVDDNNRKGNISISVDSSFFEGNRIDPLNTTTDGKKGGAIYAGSSYLIAFSVKNSEFVNNQSTLAGGAIFLTDTVSGYVCYIDNCSFDHNVTTQGNGGAIGLNVIPGGVDIANSTFVRNEALCTFQDGNAGALVVNNTPCNVTGCIFGGESAEYANKAYMVGGAIHLKGTSSIVTLTSCIVSYNEAGSSGGGVACTNSAKMSFLGGEVTYNTAGFNGGGIYISGAPNCSIYSVALLNALSDTPTHDVVEIVGNNAANNGGGMYLSSAGCTIGGEANLPYGVADKTSVEFFSNTAEGEGGALFINHTELTLDYTVDVGGDSYSTGNKAIGNGGGIAIRSSTSEKAKLTINGTLVRHNTAGDRTNPEKGNGGGIFVACDKLCQVFNHDNNQCPSASSLDNVHAKCNTGSELIINSGIISFNISDGKDIMPVVTSEGTTFGITPGGGGISVVCSSSVTIGTVGTPDIENNQYAVVISHNESNFSGGGIDSMFYSTVTLGANLLISENKACQFKEGCTNVDRWRGGGGVCVSDASTLTVNGTTFKDNVAKNSSYVYDDFEKGTRAATALSSGGAICVGHDKLTNNQPASVKTSYAYITDILADGNEGGLGGGIHVRFAQKTVVRNSQLVNNTGVQGGGLFVDNYDTVVKVANLKINGNKATDGGGIFVGNGFAGLGATLYIYDNVDSNGNKLTDSDTSSGTVIENNTASVNGGGIYLYQAFGSVGNIHIEDTDVLGNIAGGNGGGIATLGTIKMSGGYIINNKADSDKAPTGNTGNALPMGQLFGVGGGVILFNDSSFVYTVSNKNGAIYGNIASFAGDDVFATGANTKLTLPKAASMDTSAYSSDPTLSWQEDYANADTAYTKGLVGGSYTDGSEMIKRYRESMYSIAAYVDNTEPQNGSQHTGKYINSTSDTVYVAITLGVNNSRGTITITKNGIASDCDQVFIFKIVGTSIHGDPVELTVSLHSGNNFTATVTMVPQGSYSITELTEWSWRYVCESITFVDGTVTAGKYSAGDVYCNVVLDYQQMAPSVVFNNTMLADKWLDGNGVPAKNVFGDSPIDKVEPSGALIATTQSKKENGC